MVITQAAKEKASVFLKGESSVQRHGAPLKHRAVQHRRATPQGEESSPARAWGALERSWGTSLWCATPTELLLRGVISQQGGGSLEGGPVGSREAEDISEYHCILQ